VARHDQSLIEIVDELGAIPTQLRAGNVGEADLRIRARHRLLFELLAIAPELDDERCALRVGTDDVDRGADLADALDVIADLGCRSVLARDREIDHRIFGGA
jgi:hypothetical protein